MRKNKNFRKRIIVFITILVILFGGLFIYYNNIVNRPLKGEKDLVSIEVKEGEGLYTLLENLDNKSLLRSKLLIKVNLKLSNKEIKIVPGTYEVSSDISLDELLKTLETEDLDKNQIKVTIPEGYNIDKIAEALEKSGLFTKEEFINAVKKYPLPEFVKADNGKKYNLEGFLYPDTYFFNKDVKADEVIKTMITKFESVLEDIQKETGKTVKNEDIEELVIKASLIEKEARLDEERALVASVIENRIKKGMKLEFCSTINYVIGYDKAVLSYNDLNIESQYNSYKYTGLPVGPVASPGIVSLKAALQPKETEYLYFVLTEDDKSHHFSKTFEEHEKARVEAEEKRKAKSN